MPIHPVEKQPPATLRRSTAREGGGLDDGTNPTPDAWRHSLSQGHAIDSVCWNGERFVAVGEEGATIAQLKFANGSASHGDLFPAQMNQAVLEQDGVDVTVQIAVNPAP